MVIEKINYSKFNSFFNKTMKMNKINVYSWPFDTLTDRIWYKLQIT